MKKRLVIGCMVMSMSLLLMACNTQDSSALFGTSLQGAVVENNLSDVRDEGADAVLDRSSTSLDGNSDEIVEGTKEELEVTTMNVTIGTATFEITLYQNEATAALIERLPMTVTMNDLFGNEKYHYLSERLPVQAERVGRLNVGDFMLYGSDCLVLFYDDFGTSYSYTPLGFMEDTIGFREAVGNDTIEATFFIN